MKIISEAHLHTYYCDGKNSPTEMAEKAIELGYTALGFSAHSPAPFDPDCFGILGKEDEYISAIHKLKKEYAGKLEILCGIEQDYDAPVDLSKYDYLVGSVHYLEDADGKHVPLDNTTEHLEYLIQNKYNGNGDKLYQDYFDKMVDNVRKYKPTIVGHYDLIVKKNPDNRLFDETSEKYRNYAKSSLDKIIDETLSYGGIIEINTGGISRGARRTPYPSKELLAHMVNRNANITVNSDSHSINTLGFGLQDAVKLLQKVGGKTIWMIQDGKFKEFEFI